MKFTKIDAKNESIAVKMQKKNATTIECRATLLMGELLLLSSQRNRFH